MHARRSNVASTARGSAHATFEHGEGCRRERSDGENSMREVRAVGPRPRLLRALLLRVGVASQVFPQELIAIPAADAKTPSARALRGVESELPTLGCSG